MASNRRTRALSVRELNRALLARQGLLERRRLGVMREVERLVALQAQVPRDPYLALWSRLEGFDPAVLSDALESRRAVRMTLLRATLHLVSARDALALRPSFQRVVERMFFGQKAFREAAAGVDMDEVTSLLRTTLEERPGTRSDLSKAIAGRWPERDAANLAYAMYLLPTVQITPRGLWGRSARPAVTTLEHWLGADGLGPAAAPADLIRRYLAVFGPATPADFSNWSGIAGIRDVFEELRPTLRTFRDPNGRELFDLPSAPRPAPATPAPVRFLPEYDNVVLGHADRTRIVPAGVPQWTAVGWGTVLVDGFVTARWHDDANGIVVEPFRDLARTERRAVEAEGRRLAGFLGAPPRVPIGATDPSPPNQRPGHQPG